MFLALVTVSADGRAQVVPVQPRLARGTARAAVETPLVFTRQPVVRDADSPSVGTGAQLVRLDPDGSSRVLSAGFHAACEADVSWDGRKILFAGKRTVTEAWNIFEMELASGEVRQITRELKDCRTPIYTSSYYTITEKEPWDQIAFVSTRAGEADERTLQPATAIWTCKLDGSYLQRITYNLASDLDPAIMPDGRLVYATWRRATFDEGVAGRLALESLNTDGSDRAPLVPRSGGLRQRMPCVTSTGEVVYVASKDARWGAGSLSLVSLRRPLHTDRRLTSAEDGLFHSPSPLRDGRIVVAWKPADRSGSLGLYRLDPAAARLDLIVDDPEHDEFQARAIQARPRPDGRSSVVSPEDPLAELYCLNINITEFKDRSWMPAGTVKSIRVIEGVPTPFAAADARTAPAPAMAVSAEPRQLSARRVLAEYPVQPDGSFHVKVPANVPLQIQTLDERGVALRSCGWIWARSHQSQGCIGCHEDPELTPPNRVPDALKTEAVMAAVEVNRRAAPDFAREVVPIVEARCVSCHQDGGKPPRLPDLAAHDGPALDRLYAALVGPVESREAASGLGKYIHPGRSRTSPLVWHLYGTGTARPWDEAPVQGHGSAKLIPEGGGHPLTEAEKRTIVRWIDLGARRHALPVSDGQAHSGPMR